MNRFFLSFLAGSLLTGLLLCSCRTGKTRDGRDCFELSEQEKEELVVIARLSFRRPRRQLTDEERSVIQKTPPVVTIRYNGDCSGEFAARWKLADKSAGVIYRGLLNDPRKRSMVFEIIPSSDRILYKGVPGKKDTAK